MPGIAHTRRAAGACLAALAGLALAGCGGASGARHPPSRTAEMRSIFEAEGPVRADPAGTLATLRRLGADTLRLYLPWGGTGSVQLAPAPSSHTAPAGFNAADPAAYPPANWAPFDAIIATAHRDGIRVDLTLGGPPPLWARGAGDPGTGTPRNPLHPQWRPDVAAFGRFVEAVGRRYSGHYRDPVTGRVLPRVDFWAVWNEPNFGPDIAPQAIGSVAVAPTIYRNLVDAAWRSLGATGHGGDTVLIGELAPYGQAFGAGPGAFGYTVPLRFLRTVYCLDAGLHPLSGSAASAVGCPASPNPSSFRRDHPALFAASALSIHPYTQGPPAVSLPGEPDYANLASLPRVEHTIDGALSAYGVSRRLPIFSTEFGIHTNPPETVPGTAHPAQAAVFLNQAEYLSWRDPWVRSFDQYLIEDGPTGVFATGLEFYGGRPKPTYAAYRMPLYLPTQRLHGPGRLEVWGAVRPARYASPSFERVTIEFRAAGAKRFRALRTVSLTPGSVYFDVKERFAGPGSVRSAWRAPSGSTYYSRIAPITSF